MNFSDTLFRASSIGHLMTSPKSKADKDAGNLSESAKTHLIDIYVSAKYNRQSDIFSKYISKGLMVEEDSITLYSRLKKKFYKKNEEMLSNDILRGTPDMYAGENIRNANHVIDVKSSWDIFTFHRTLSKDVNDMYYWQLQAYMLLTGAKSATLAYCLIDTPLVMIEDEKRKLMWKMGVATSEESDYKQAAEELERLMTYSDIPMDQRVIEFQFDRNDEDIQAMYVKVEKARKWLIYFEAVRYPDLILAQDDPEVNATIVNAHE
jgi:hypothetical protein